MGNLSEPHIGQLIADSLRLDLEECAELTHVLYNKAQGNVLFTMQLLKELRRNDILFVSMYNLKWMWDISKVESTAGALGRKQKHAESMRVHLDALYLVNGFPKRYTTTHLLRYLWEVRQLFKRI